MELKCDMELKEAVKLHREMWSDMKKTLGDNPDGTARIAFKQEWLAEHGYSKIDNSSFLCEYALSVMLKEMRMGIIHSQCDHCPIDWSRLTPDKESDYYGCCIYSDCNDDEVWESASIGEILALPERKGVK